MGADILHTGHLNIIKKAKKYGEIVIGLFTDLAIAEYKSFPLINYNQRLEIMRSIKGVKKIMKQNTWDYSENLNKLKPDYLIHGDDWKKGIQKTRDKVINLLKKWNGKLIEVPYTKQPEIKESKKHAKYYFQSRKPSFKTSETNKIKKNSKIH